MGADHVDHPGRAGHLDADLRADGPAAVRGDHVASLDGEVLTGVVVLHRDAHAVVELFPAGDLVVVADLPGRPGLGLLTQERFESQLRIVAGHHGAVGFVRRPEGTSAEGIHLVDDLAVQWAIATHARCPSHLAELLDRGPDRIDGIGHAVLTERLHRSLIEVMSLGQHRGGGVALDQEVLDAEVGQEDGRGQSAATPADDQDRDLVFRHCSSLSVGG